LNQSLLYEHTPLSLTLNPVFYVPLFTLVTKTKLYLDTKNIGGTFAPPPQVTPERVNINLEENWTAEA